MKTLCLKLLQRLPKLKFNFYLPSEGKFACSCGLQPYCYSPLESPLLDFNSYHTIYHILFYTLLGPELEPAILFLSEREHSNLQAVRVRDAYYNETVIALRPFRWPKRIHELKDEILGTLIHIVAKQEMTDLLFNCVTSAFALVFHDCLLFFF